MLPRTLASSYVANKETGTGQSQLARTGSWRIPWEVEPCVLQVNSILAGFLSLQDFFLCGLSRMLVPSTGNRAKKERARPSQIRPAYRDADESHRR